MAVPVYIVGKGPEGGLTAILESLAVCAFTGLAMWNKTHPAFAIGAAIGALALWLYTVQAMIRHARLLYWLYAILLSGVWAIFGFIVTAYFTPDQTWQWVGCGIAGIIALSDKSSTVKDVGPDGGWDLI